MKFKGSIVVDSSVAFKWIHSEQEKYVDKADLILKRSKEKNIAMVLPELAKYEIFNAILYKKMSIFDSQLAVEKFFVIPLQFMSLDEETARMAIKLASELQITFYDASFIALAQSLKAPLVTDNPKHQKKFKGVTIKIIPLKDYK